VRIHVERVIGKMRNYLILQSTTQWIKYACYMTLWLLLLPWQIYFLQLFHHNELFSINIYWYISG
jgi:hypothetical protein